jgi:branched-chain amino acid transport system substrate-binding protein
VGAYEQAYRTWPSRYSESGWVCGQLITTALDMLNGDLSDRGRVREALKTALPRIKAPRGPLEFDAHRQVISPVYVLRAERRDGRLVNAIIDKIPAVSQEATWTWWNKK